MSKHIGFTLIELMVVVAIIGILAAVAIPQYQTYTVRAQVSEALSIAREIQANVNDFYKQHGRFPSNNKAAGVPEPQYLIGNYVKEMRVDNGAIHVTLGNKINQQLSGKMLTLQPLIVKGSPASPISWNCGTAEPPTGMETVGENKTDIGYQYLSGPCRGVS